MILKQAEILEKIEVVSHNTNPNTFATEINDILTFAAKSCGLKKRHVSQTQHNNFPWFDKECANIKTEIKAVAKMVSKHPIISTTEKHFFYLKENLKILLKGKNVVIGKVL